MIPVQRPFLGPEELAAVSGVFDSRWLGMGAVSSQFETRIREYLGVKHVLAVNTGTSALHLALAALDLPFGAEVIVPSLTFVASVQAILAVGARPVFCEVDPDTLNINVADALARITPQTRAIMPVHFGGLPCDMDRLLPEARKRGLSVVEDAAHAFGSAYKGRRVGTLGDVTCFSFDPIKNITCGEGGAVVTNDDDIAARVLPKRLLGIDNDTWTRQKHQRNWSYNVATVGFRYHLSNINAAIGLQQFARLDQFRARKQTIVGRYDEAFRNLPGLALVRHDPDTFPFFYVVRILNRRRDALIASHKEKGIGTGIHYIPNHLQPLFAGRGPALPVTEKLFAEIVTLPLYFEMTDDDVDRVIAETTAFLKHAN
jgi:perosamine synthetase